MCLKTMVKNVSKNTCWCINIIGQSLVNKPNDGFTSLLPDVYNPMSYYGSTKNPNPELVFMYLLCHTPILLEQAFTAIKPE